MRPIRTIAVFPTLFTLGNLVCGFFAIVVAARVRDADCAGQRQRRRADTDQLMHSGWLIFLAMVFDALDGYVARLARTASDFGAELDSLCDVVTFGVAPGFLLVKMCPQFTFLHKQAVWVIAAVVCGLRGACGWRGSTSKRATTTTTCTSAACPVPAAAAVIAGFAIMFYTLRTSTQAGSRTLRRQIDIGLQTRAAVLRAVGRRC